MLKFRNPWKKTEREEEESSRGTAYFGHVPNATLNDTKAYVSAWLEKYTDAPGAAGLYLHKYQEGYLFEIQERGIGKRSWLPSILETWDRQAKTGEDQSITLALDRTVQGQRQGERISFVILPEGIQDSGTTPGLAPTGPHLVSLRQDYSTIVGLARWVFRGTVLILLISLGVKAFRPHTIVRSRPMPPPVAVFRLPIAQWPALISSAQRGDYVSALRYRDQTWQVQTSPSPRNGPRKSAPVRSSQKTSPARPAARGKP